MVPDIKITKQTINAPSRRMRATWTFETAPPIDQIDKRTFQLYIELCKIDGLWDKIKEFLLKHDHDVEQDSGSSLEMRVQFHYKKSAMEFKLRFIK